MISIINAVFGMFFQLFEWILNGFGEVVVAQIKTRRNEEYKADFLAADKALKRNSTGFYFGHLANTLEQSQMHALVVGQSGSGKSTAVLIPNILRSVCSLCIHDPSGELYQLTARAKKQQGYTIKVIWYDNPELSETINPLSRCHTKSDFRQLAKIIIGSNLGEGGNDKFWNSSAESLIVFFLRLIKNYVDPDLQNLYNLATMVNTFAGTPKAIDKLVINSKDDELYEEYKSIVAMENKVLMNIISTAKAALSLFLDDRIATITNSNSISFEELRRSKTVIYLRSDITNLKYYSCISSIFFEQFFQAMMKELPKADSLPVFCLLDELPSMHLTMLSTAISNLRKFGVSLMCVVQTEAQIISNYGVENARNIMANCFSKLYLPGQPLETCRSLEILCGKYEFQNDAGQQKIRPLLTMDEIRQLNDSLLFLGNLPVIKFRPIPYYEQRDLLNLANLPVLELTEKNISSQRFISDAQ